MQFEPMYLRATCNLVKCFQTVSDIDHFLVSLDSLFLFIYALGGLPRWLSGNLPANAGAVGSIPGLGNGMDTPVFLPGKFHGHRVWWLQSMGLQRVRHD